MNKQDDAFKKEIQENLIKIHRKYKKVLNAERHLSEQHPVNLSRIEKQKEARKVLSLEMERLCYYLIDMGETLTVKRKRGLQTK